MTHKPLGRGLGALLSAEKSAPPLESIEVDESLIDPCPVQPRTRFDQESLNSLAQSIKTSGVVQPLLVRRNGSRFEVIAGERRLRAARIAGLRSVPAVVKEVADENVLEIALIENIQREDLNAIEEAQAYKRLIETVGLTQESLASRIGRDRSYVTNYLRLLRLPNEIQALVENGSISMAHARTLLGIEEHAQQRRLAARVVKDKLSVRELERIIKRLVEDERPHAARQTAKVDPNVRALESKLRRELGTQVRLSQKPGGTGGVILINYFDLSELTRLTNRLLSRP